MRSQVPFVVAFALVGCATDPTDSDDANEPDLVETSTTMQAIGIQGTYSAWNLPNTPPGGFYNVDQVIFPGNLPSSLPGQVAPSYFYAEQFHMVGSGSNNGYIGIQADANGRRAIFSIWGANGAQCGIGMSAECAPFEEFGTGFRTVIDYPWVSSHSYRLRLWVSDSDMAGEWWVGAIADLTTGAEQQIGSIRVPHSYGWLAGDLYNFVEWYSPQPARCDQLPLSVVFFAPPTGNVDEQTADAPHNWFGTGECLSQTQTTDGFARHVNGAQTMAVTAVQAPSGNLHGFEASGERDHGFGMMAGTSPAVAVLSTGGREYAFQANNGELWTVGDAVSRATGLGMKAGTSPAITALANGGFQVAFQANTGSLWTTGTLGTRNLGYGMMAGTSPSIAAVSGGYQIAFQANTSRLWVTGALGTKDTGYGMAPNTSPSITAINGSYQVAFQANTTNLWWTGVLGTRDWKLGMKSRTSPSLATQKTGTWALAFQANSGNLWSYNPQGGGDSGLGMAPDTSPRVRPLAFGGYDIAFQANSGILWMVGNSAAGDMGVKMAPGTSPGG